MNYEKLNTMTPWERKKALYLIENAERIGMDLDGYGEIAVNPNSGYTYLWTEDYPFCLYMPIDCNLTRDSIYILWTSMEDGTEVEITLNNLTLDDIYKWTETAEVIFQEKPDGYKDYDGYQIWKLRKK